MKVNIVKLKKIPDCIQIHKLLITNNLIHCILDIMNQLQGFMDFILTELKKPRIVITICNLLIFRTQAIENYAIIPEND